MEAVYYLNGECKNFAVSRQTIVCKWPGKRSRYRYSLRAGHFGVQTPVVAKEFLFSTPAQTGPWAHQTPVQRVPQMLPACKAVGAWR